MAENSYKINIGMKVKSNLLSLITYLFVLIVLALIFGFVVSIFIGNVSIFNVLIIGSITFPFFIFLGIALLISLVYTPIYYNSISYEVNAKEFVIRDGVFGRSEKSLPYSKVQHVVVSQSFWDRWLGIADVNIQTAGQGEVVARRNGQQQAGFGGPQIPALLLGDALKVRDFIISKVDSTKGTGIVSK